MTNIIMTLAGLNFLHLVWLFFFVSALHELEEWNIDRFERRNFSGLPPAATDRSARMVIAFVILLGLVWASLAALPGDPAAAAWIFLPAIAIMTHNALQHIYWSFYFRQVAPGVITAVLLLIPTGLCAFILALQQGLVPAWYAAIWAGLIVAGSIQTGLAGSKMTPLVRAANTLGILLSQKIRIGG